MEAKNIKIHVSRVFTLLILVILIAFTGLVYADQAVPALPENQDLVTGTSMNVNGLITETDTAIWSLTSGGVPVSWTDPIVAQWPGWNNGGLFGSSSYEDFITNILNTDPPYGSRHVLDFINYYLTNPEETETSPEDVAQLQSLYNFLQNQGGLHDPPLYDNEVRYTTGYNDQYSGVSGQQTFAKTMAVSTANTIADQSNIKANTNIQFIAVDMGRATRSEDLLVDGASQATSEANSILCPFEATSTSIIPAYCNIEQAGSALDTTLTSTVTSADARFVGSDAGIPVVLNYNINSEGLTIGKQSSPMIGSASAYLKVHVQEARNQSVQSIAVGVEGVPDMWYTLDPAKSEDLVYSETSSASGLISKFSKNMQYQSGKNLI